MPYKSAASCQSLLIFLANLDTKWARTHVLERAPADTRVEVKNILSSVPNSQPSQPGLSELSWLPKAANRD